jgi:hypothetical protein
MKTFIAILLFLSCSLSGYAQIDSLNNGKEHKNELGIDMIYFLNVFRNQYEQANENTMVFAYDHHLNHERIFRFYLSLGIIQQSVKQDTLPAIKDLQTDLIAFPGYGTEQHINKHWAYFYGGQLKIENAMGKSTTADDGKAGATEQYFSNWFLGPSGYAGIKYLINNRISLQIESDIYFTYSTSISKTTNSRFPETNTTYKTTGYNTEYKIPKTILLNFSF